METHESNTRTDYHPRTCGFTPHEDRIMGYGTFEELGHHVRAGVFGRLLELAAPVVQYYRSDLFHDAHWLTNNVHGPDRFLFSIGESGTHIGTDTVIVGAREFTYLVEVTCKSTPRWDPENGDWYVTTELLNPVCQGQLTNRSGESTSTLDRIRRLDLDLFETWYHGVTVGTVEP